MSYQVHSFFKLSTRAVDAELIWFKSKSKQFYHSWLRLSRGCVSRACTEGSIPVTSRGMVANFYRVVWRKEKSGGGEHLRGAAGFSLSPALVSQEFSPRIMTLPPKIQTTPHLFWTLFSSFTSWNSQNLTHLSAPPVTKPRWRRTCLLYTSPSPRD